MDISNLYRKQILKFLIVQMLHLFYCNFLLLGVKYSLRFVFKLGKMRNDMERNENKVTEFNMFELSRITGWSESGSL